MMDQVALGSLIADAFIVFLPFLAGGVIAFLLVLMLLVMFRGFLPEDK